MMRVIALLLSFIALGAITIASSVNIGLDQFDLCNNGRYADVCVIEYPTDDLVAHFSTDNGLSASSGTVISWLDRSAENNTLVPVGNPQVIASAINGYSAVSFDGDGDALKTTILKGMPVGAADRTYCYVVNYISLGSGGLNTGSSAANEAFGLSVDSAGKLRVNAYGANDQVSTTDGTGEGWMFQCAVVASNTMTHYKDNVQIDTASVTYATNVRKLVMGADLDEAPYIEMQVSEVFIYADDLTTSERNDLWGYINEKYFNDGGSVDIPPVAARDSANVDQGEAVTVSVLTNDTDADGTLVNNTVTITTAATNGTAVAQANGTVIYTHNDTETTGDYFEYTVDDNDGNTSNTQIADIFVTLDNPPIAVSDTEFLPLVTAGAAISTCPSIPSSFTGTTTNVSNSAEFWAAVPNLDPGDAIIVTCTSCGSGWAGTIPASASGTAANPTYILSQNVHSAVLSGSSKWHVQADHIVMAGFKRAGSGSLYINNSDNGRFACNHNDLQGSSNIDIQVAASQPNFSIDWEIDNNTSVNHYYTWYWNQQCNLYNQDSNASCKGSNTGHYLHHNSVTSLPGGTAPRPFTYAFNLGVVGWLPLRLNDHLSASEDRMEATLANNTIRWRSGQNLKSIEIKSSGNVIKNNCFINTSPISVRTGYDNLFYGNWGEGTEIKKNFDNHGYGTIVAFNYFGDGGNSEQAMSIWAGLDWQRTASQTNIAHDTTWAYVPHSDNQIEHNVFNRFTGWIEYQDLNSPSAPTGSYVFLLEGSQYKPDAEDNVISDNKLYYVGTPSNFVSSGSGTMTEAAFTTNNPGWDKSSNIHVNSELPVGVECGKANHVNGVPGTVLTHSKIKGGVQTLTAPSWWN